MRLIDCFAEAIAVTVEFLTTVRNGNQPEYEEVSVSIRRSLVEKARSYLTGGYSEVQYQNAKYAVVAFIDEAILGSGWEHQNKWKNELLQMSEFNTANAGEGFFERLNSLNPVDPADRDVREVYYYCMVYGFSGKYFRSDDRHKLDEIRNTQFQLLTGGQRKPFNLQDGLLCPEGYAEEKTDYDLASHLNLKAFYIGGPILVFLILFFLWRYWIIEAATDLVQKI